MSTFPSLPDRKVLIDEIRSHLQVNIAAFETELKSIAEGMAEDGKSSAGDKYETSREMGQQAHNRIAGVLQQTRTHLRNIVDEAEKQGVVCTGAIVQTTSHIFYIGSSFGQLHGPSHGIFGVGKEAPIVKTLSGLIEGKTFYLNGKEETITAIL